jgi:hypothetical protein
LRRGRWPTTSRPPWLFFLFFAAKYQPSFHLFSYPATAVGTFRCSIRREQYRNFSLVYSGNEVL